MNAKAVPQGAGKNRLGASLGLVTAVVGLLTGLVLVGPATAASPVKNGQIRACYKVKGKAKGAMRVVKGKRCKRGERPLTWSVAGPAGAAGSQGSPGAQGAQGVQGNPGAAGSTGAGASLANLETKVASLSLEVDALESLLAGVGSGDLSGLLSKLNGITGAQLNEAVGAVPTVSSLVSKVSSLEGLLGGVGSGDLSGALAKLDAITGTELEDVVSDLPALQSTVSGLDSTVSGLNSTVSGLGTTVGGLSTTVTGLSTKTGELCNQAKELNEQTGLLGAAFGEIKVLSGLVTLGLPTVDGLDPFACTP